jgi:hypothetical protein
MDEGRGGGGGGWRMMVGLIKVVKTSKTGESKSWGHAGSRNPRANTAAHTGDDTFATTAAATTSEITIVKARASACVVNCRPQPAQLAKITTLFSVSLPKVKSH